MWSYVAIKTDALDLHVTVNILTDLSLRSAANQRDAARPHLV